MDANPQSHGLNPGENPPPADSPLLLELTKTLPAAAVENAENLSLSGLGMETLDGQAKEHRQTLPPPRSIAT